MESTSVSRRDFIRAAAGGALALTALSASRVLGANDRIQMAVVGCGGMGTGHLHSLVGRGDWEAARIVVDVAMPSLASDHDED